MYKVFDIYGQRLQSGMCIIWYALLTATVISFNVCGNFPCAAQESRLPGVTVSGRTWGPWTSQPGFLHLKARAKCDFTVDQGQNSSWSFQFLNDYPYAVNYIFKNEASLGGVNSMDTAPSQDSLGVGRRSGVFSSTLHGTCKQLGGLKTEVLCVVQKGDVDRCYEKYHLPRPTPENSANLGKKDTPSSIPTTKPALPSISQLVHFDPITPRTRESDPEVDDLRVTAQNISREWSCRRYAFDSDTLEPQTVALLNLTEDGGVQFGGANYTWTMTDESPLGGIPINKRRAARWNLSRDEVSSIANPENANTVASYDSFGAFASFAPSATDNSILMVWIEAIGNDWSNVAILSCTQGKQ